MKNQAQGNLKPATYEMLRIDHQLPVLFKMFV